MPEGARGGNRPQMHLPQSRLPRLVLLFRRLLAAIVLIVFVAVVAWAGRGGYIDQTNEDGVSFLDALYYDGQHHHHRLRRHRPGQRRRARLSTTLLVTPARILFLS